MARSESSFFPVLIRVCPLSQIRNPAGGFGTHHCKQSPAEPVQEKVATSPSGHPRTKQPWQSFLPQPRLSHAEGSPFFPRTGYPMLQRRNEKITRWLVSTCQNSCSGTSQISFQLSVSKFHPGGTVWKSSFCSHMLCVQEGWGTTRTTFKPTDPTFFSRESKNELHFTKLLPGHQEWQKPFGTALL